MDLSINQRFENTSRIGVLLWFSQPNSKQDQLRSRPRTAPMGCMQQSKECISRTRRFFHRSKREGKGRTREHNRIKNCSRDKTKHKIQTTLWMNLATLPSDTELKVTSTQIRAKQLQTSAKLGYSKQKHKSASQRDGCPQQPNYPFIDGYLYFLNYPWIHRAYPLSLGQNAPTPRILI